MKLEKTADGDTLIDLCTSEESEVEVDVIEKVRELWWITFPSIPTAFYQPVNFLMAR